ncbi:hypothetical protein P3L51_24685 [Streptomyces sp. PSRA5]|uniref:hypothetical protein n=1 Tax=Streptomyces panacea TaxID=3035064 RepID=UPI00339BE980
MPAKPGATPKSGSTSAGPDAGESGVDRKTAVFNASRSESTSEGKPAAPAFAPAKPDASPEAEATPMSRPDPDEPGADQGTAAVKGAKSASAAAAVAPEARSDSRTASDAAPQPKADAAPKSRSTSAGPDSAPAPRSTSSQPEAAPDVSPKAGSGGAEARKADAAPTSRSTSSQPEAAPDVSPKAGSGGADAPRVGAAPTSAPAESGAGSDVGEPGVDRKTAVFKALRSDSASDRKPAEPPFASPKAGPGGADAPRADSAAPARPAPAKRDAEPGPDEDGVDSKTAVFKALKRPGVDQPTAMLKLPPQPPAQAASPPASAPELPAERTSKFVPLRADEARVPARPAAGPAPGTGVVEAERTRQQPMPPLPPLDLLAELTNKPAPPETPTRTVVRRVKIWTPLLVLALIIFAVAQAVRPLPTPSLNLTAKSTYTFEGDKPALPWPGEGQGFMAATGLGTVDSFGEQKAVPIGSVAKAMTAYVVLKDKPLKKGAKGPSITVDAKAEEDGGLDAQGESTLNTVKEGDKLTQHDALAALMIPSANNIARLLARWDANGSEEEFVKKMNDTADELGMKNTEYTDPSGLDATTVSSAEDQVKLGQKLVEIEALMDITKLPEWTDPSGKTWRNYNTLVPYDGALGIKTGSTTKAGGNLLFAAHKMVGDTDQLIVGAVLGQHKSPIIDTVNAVSKDVMRATQDELEGATIVKKGEVVGEVDNGMGTTVPVVAVEDVKAVGWSGLTVKLELTGGAKAVPETAAAGTHVGTLTVGEGKSQVQVAVALQGDLAEPSFGDKLTRVG